MPLRLDGGAPVDHAGSWTDAVASTSESAIAAVGRVLASKDDVTPGHGFGVHIHELVKVRDKQGRTALEASTEGPRKAIYLHLLFCGRYELVIGAPEHRSATSVVLRALDRGEKTDYGKVFDDADKDGSGTLGRKELAPVAKSIGLDAELFLRAEDKSIDRSSFVGICKQQLGDGQRSVVIKLMQEKEQWERERDARAKNQLDSRFIVLELPGVPSDDEIAAAVLVRGGGLGAIAKQYLPEGISLGTRAIIMDAADRNLHQIFLQERPDLNGVRAILQQVFEAVAHLHAKGLMHGDLKLLNVVRFRRDNRLRLIDLDAAAKIVPVGGEGESYAGAKFSSGVLPPELFHELKQGEAEALEAYWQRESKELQAKVAPKSFSERGVVKSIYIVKSFRTADGGKPVFGGLPYSEELVHASEKVDAWSLGALAFVLLAGEPLVPLTRDDDCASGAAMRMLHAWGTQPGVVVERLEKVGDPAARDLVSKLLQREPSARLSVKDALEHVFFRTGRDGGHVEPQEKVLEELRLIKEEQTRQGEEQRKQTEMLVVVMELSIENKRELRRTCDVLLKGIFEASEVTIPTTFVVVLKKLPEALNKEEKAKLLKIAADGSGVTLGNDNFSLNFTGDSAGVGGKYADTLDTGMKWLCRLKTIGSELAAGKVGDAFETIKKGLGDLVTGKTMYLYLVDELTGEPVCDPSGHYPIEITTPSDVVPKLLPVMQVGLRAMSVFNGAAGVARMFGYPVPTVPEAWAAGARESVALLKRESSVEKYDVVQGVLGQDGATKESESVRGASLRELQRFFEEHDAKKGYAGLRRIADEDGTAVWTALTDPSAVKAAIEARAKERREEERRGDELLQQALELSSSAAGPTSPRYQREAEELRPVAAAAAAAPNPAAHTTTDAAVTATWPWSFFFGPSAVAAAPTATETLPSAPAPAPAAGASSGGQQEAHAVVSTAGAMEAAVAEVAAAAKAAVESVAAELAANQKQQQQRLDSHEKQLAQLQTQMKEPPQQHTERREEERRGDELLQQALKMSYSPAAAAAAGASSGEQQSQPDINVHLAVCKCVLQ
ncbi:hypothetical protein EMIHUDRAFT_119917 [Emiliania huxleyi CCMP1516]|uniref:Protein kinase domain-containing protein n=2 Tax=Emiliania huxleyi TaxID=2903 RepID=A0A0D3IPU4_EMIH1|nr:hypothetical protein EMIHUDRAFT_119917 [Emiliania huxleyi CCMP1516]EOD13279.1 hypothetical protein EMIHUDRAFT_119917 [Emiliania huxleyi CCMP1516]|eukprot:XP_005765708.1 hypothetical protein EMIHUDRAFT_119917 [Emiliania huxleyi CCMP1516]